MGNRKFLVLMCCTVGIIMGLTLNILADTTDDNYTNLEEVTDNDDDTEAAELSIRTPSGADNTANVSSEGGSGASGNKDDGSGDNGGGSADSDSPACSVDDLFSYIDKSNKVTMEHLQSVEAGVEELSYSLGDINDTEGEQKEVVEDIYKELEDIHEEQSEFQEKVLSALSVIDNSISSNALTLSGSVSGDELVEEDTEDMDSILEEIIQDEAVSENEVDEDSIESVSQDVVSDNSVSVDDIAVIHDDLKNIFHILIVATAFLTIIAATQFEHLFFKRLRG